MRTRSSGPVVEPSTTPRRRRNKKHSQQVDPTIVEKPVVTMADTRTMAELLQAPTEGYRDAIVIPAILAENFELNTITSTIKYKDVPNSSIKLMLFPFSIEGAAWIWLEKEPPRSIQRFDESFCEAWDRFKDILRACLHYGFTELHQIDTFYNSLTSTYQDSLNVAADGNLLTKTPKDALTLIENKLKVHTSRNRPLVAKVSTNTSTSGLSPDVAAHTDVVKALLLKNTTFPSSFIKAVEERYVYMCSKFIKGNAGHRGGRKESRGNKGSGATKYRKSPSSDVPTQAPTSEPVNAPKPKPNLPYPSRLNNQKLRERDDHQMMKIIECLALADLGASINLMPLSIWKKLSLPELTPTQMILELAYRSTTSPSDIAEDVFVKVGKFYFLADFVVVDYVVDPRVPLILRRPFLRTARALIDVYGEELTLRVDDEAITFKVGQTSRYSYNDVVSINRIDVIDVACEEYAQEVLGFLDSSTSGNPTPSLDPILSTSSPSLTPFEEGDFILEEIEACLTNDSIPPGIDDDDFDPEGDLLLPEKLELKDLPSHLEYAFLEGTDKLPVIIAKNLKEDEKVRLLKVLKSHKRAIAWKISDIKGIDPQFCTHKILMEDDSKPAIQHQRRVNPKIHEVIKKEVIKLLDAGLIYPISDSPWVSPVHCVPKKGGITVIENEDNELIPTRLVTGWRVCIDYLNDATRKDHFLLPIMDQMLERLARNEFYCFLDGFSGYFQILIDPQDQEKTTFTCPYGTFAYRRSGESRADHLSRLENPHQSDLEKKEITETFLLETLGMVTFCGDLSTPWFADIANYHSGNFIVKGMSSQQKEKFFKDVRSRGSDFDIPVVFSLIIALLRNKKLNMTPTPLIERVIISTPMKNHMLIDHEYVNCPLRFDDRIRPANLLPIHMFDFDVILGMDWLASHRATIDCYARTVIFGNVRQPEFVYHGSSPLKSVKLISAMKARTLISHGCQGFLASVMDTSLESPNIENLSVNLPKGLRNESFEKLKRRLVSAPDIDSDPSSVPVVFKYTVMHEERFSCRGFCIEDLETLIWYGEACDIFTDHKVHQEAQRDDAVEIPMWKWDGDFPWNFVTGLPQLRK
ncbi:reverse transcriptase domain-containing protein [Tanacetum coccineum]|uniref:Reverse transcriptase domain-containing protein n=1 Tax=Tanacetum coccineum TaxID=301880 RepID=A0ABQ4WC46_9ASTR